jgi:beta-glucanase (GH16 family)
MLSMISAIILSSFLLLSCKVVDNSTFENTGLRDKNNYQLVWSDDFNYPDSQLDEDWNAQNGPSTHILCSRWRENAVVENGILHLKNKKENRGGQEWTSASIWSKQRFQYGYFYGLEWTKDSLIFSFDGNVIRRMKNEFCHSPAPVYLSEAIISWAGEVTDAIDVTSMEVDWVKVYQVKQK